LKAQYASIKEEVDAAVAEVFESQHFIMGPKVRECEEAIADYCQCAHSVGVSSGTDALLIALMAENIGAGDEVITTPYTFFATAGCIARTGATPVFVDIDPITYNIDPGQIEERITPQTRAIIPVHLFGQMADMDAIMEIADRRQLTVIEDAAQSIGAEFQGQRAGSIGHYGCFSFFPAKNLGAAGDGGMVVTNDGDRAERLRVLRVHGSKPKYYHHVIGGNFRLDALHAAVVTVKLRHLDVWTAARQHNAAMYDNLFAASGVLDRDGVLSTPQVVVDRHVFNQYVLRLSRRDAVQAALSEEGISNAIYYPLGLHQQACFASLGYGQGDFPVCEAASRETLAIPIHPDMTAEDIRTVVACIVDSC
jgi:dTDP-4-amino-4,6-dideoxygalactose transaminase